MAGRVVLVTGAGGLIGDGIATAFEAAGATVVRHTRQQAALPDDAERLITETVEEHGRLDALVNNAGIQPVQDLTTMTVEQWREVVDVNLTSAFATTQAAAKVIRNGSVTHIASIEGSHPAHGHAHYSASKAALIMHARSAALEYGPHLRVNTVSPGLIDRPGLAGEWPDGVRRWHEAAPLTRLGTPEDVGNACVFLASPLAGWITGHDLVVDGGVSARPTW